MPRGGRRKCVLDYPLTGKATDQGHLLSFWTQVSPVRATDPDRSLETLLVLLVSGSEVSEWLTDTPGWYRPMPRTVDHSESRGPVPSQDPRRVSPPSGTAWYVSQRMRYRRTGSPPEMSHLILLFPCCVSLGSLLSSWDLTAPCPTCYTELQCDGQGETIRETLG